RRSAALGGAIKAGETLAPVGGLWPSVAKPAHELADVLRPQLRLRHGQMAKRRLGARLDDEAAVRALRHQAIEDVKHLGIELIVVKIEGKDLGLDRRQTRLRIIVGR